jgi:hypothetical protein
MYNVPVPVIVEPVPNEVLALGVTFETSDYGAAALSVRAFMLRLACTNGLIVDSLLRQVHLGRRLSDGFSFSNETLRLDTAATASAIGDIVRTQLSRAKLDELQAAVRAAHQQQIAPHAIDTFLKKAVTKSEADAIKTAFSSADVINMPPGQTTWRLAQAISWIAGQSQDDERKLELMRTAGSLLPRAA